MLQPKYQREPLMPHQVPELPWMNAGADIFVLNGQSYLLLVDYLAKYPEVLNLPDATAYAVIQKMKSVFARHGIPKELVSDHVPFASCSFMGAQAHILPPRFSLVQWNGRAIHQDSETCTKESHADRHRPTSCTVVTEEQPVTGLNMSLARMLMGRVLRSTLSCSSDVLEQSTPQHVHDKIQDLQRRQKQHYDQHAKPLPMLSPGDTVHMQTCRGWGPAVVIRQRDEPRSYTVQTPAGLILRRNRRHLRIHLSFFRNTDLDEHLDSEVTPQTPNQMTRHTLESNYRGSDLRCMWNALRAITDYKGGGICDTGLSSSLADELNAHYAGFEANTTSPATKLPVDQESCAPSISVSEVVRSFKAVNPHKAPGPDGVHSRRLRAWAIQLAEVFTDIFNLSLRLSVIPTGFKRTTIVPVPKTPAITCLNDYRPAALTSAAMKCFERLVRAHICSSLPATMDPHQPAYRSNRSTDDTIALTVHSALTHLDRKNTYVRMLFIDYSSAFNTIILAKLIPKLTDSGLNSHLCSWVLDFLTARHTSNTLFKFADDTTILGLITDGDETAYRDEVSALSEWCYHNNLSLNTSRAEEMIVDYRKLQRGGHSPLCINGAEVERVSSVRRKKFGLPPDILTNFYRCTIESILTACITVWYGSCTAYDRKALKRVVRTAEFIIGSKPPDLQDIYQSCCLRTSASPAA
ncbi:hypothetical protein NFI96_005346 [Prochilodus magdalenae]|nr:hypothetical protein NFI96_005346 [Prochilodus magdalenae]